MKRKISVLLLIVFAFPLLAFMGCGRETYYNITLSYSGAGHIDPPQTSYSAGSQVRFVATGNIVGWVYQNSTLLKSNSTYSITETKDGEVVVRSELSFKASASTKGSYTAVFADEKMPYAELYSWRITTDISANPEQDSPAKQPILSASFAISQGITELETVSEVNNASVKNNVEYTFDGSNSVIKLDPEYQTQISVNNINFVNEPKSAKFSQFRTMLLLQRDTEETELSNYSQYAEYGDGEYKIVFTFDFSSTTYYFVLTYKELS